MKISELVQKLEELKSEHGDIIVTHLDGEWNACFEVTKLDFMERYDPYSKLWSEDVGDVFAERIVLQ